METEGKSIQDVEFGEELPIYLPDTSLKKSTDFAALVGWEGARFSNHEKGLSNYTSIRKRRKMT